MTATASVMGEMRQSGPGSHGGDLLGREPSLVPDCEMNIRKLPSGVTTLLASWETMGPRTAALRVDRSEFLFIHARLGPRT
jgi:hypothetical protein